MGELASRPGVTAALAAIPLRNDFSCGVGLNNPPRLSNPNLMGVKMFKFGKKAKLAALAVLSTASMSAMAAVPAEVTTALTDAKADGATVAGAVLVVIVGIAVFKYMRRGV